MLEKENRGRVGYNRCAVPGCPSRTGQGIIFRPFPNPKKPELVDRWKEVLPKNINVIRSTAICELHFGPNEFERVRQDGRKKFKESAVPCNFDIVCVANKKRVPFASLGHKVQSTQNIFNTNNAFGQKPCDTAAEHLPISPMGDVVAEAGTIEILGMDFQKPAENPTLSQTFNDECMEMSVESDLFSPLFDSSRVSTDTFDTSNVILDANKLEAGGSTSSTQLSDIITDSHYISPESSTSMTDLNQLEATDSIQTTQFIEADSPELDLDYTTGLFRIKPEGEKASQLISLQSEPSIIIRELHYDCDDSDKNILDEESGVFRVSSNDDCPQSPLHTGEILCDENPTSPSKMSKDELLKLIYQRDAEINRLSKLTAEKDDQISQLLDGHFSTCTFKLKYDSLRKAKERIEQAYKRGFHSPWLSDSRLQKLLQRLARKSNRGLKWDIDDFRDGLILKMKCGSSGYSSFVKLYPILPSVRSLQETVQFIRFDAGILDEVFDLLDDMVKRMPKMQRYCSLVLDEIAIDEGIRYDNSLNKWIGSCSLSSHSGRASKALVFLLAGAAVRWKIAVAVHFTKSKSDEAKERKSENPTGHAYANVIKSVIKRSSEIGLTVKAVVSDMGPDNLAFWKVFGVTGSKTAEVKTSFPSSDSTSTPSEVFVLPDSVHLQKAIKAMMDSNKIITLPADIVEEEGLPSAVVDYSHIDDLYEFESGCELKVAFRLRKSNIHCSKHFKKMKVGATKAVLCHRTGVGLKQLSQEKNKPEYETTAWFIMLLNTFFTLVTCRSKGLAISNHREDVFEKAINLIKRVDYVFTNMKVGRDGQWKPAQRGMRVLCASLLGLIDFFITERVFQFLMLGRFTSDCIENLFSCIRLCQSIPHASALLQCLKVITLAQFSEAVRGSSYDYEESAPLSSVDFLEEARKRAKARASERFDQSLEELMDNSIPKLTPDNYKKISKWEEQVVYDMAGSVICAILRSNLVVCENCINATKWTADVPHAASGVTSMKEFTELRADDGKRLLLVYVSDAVFKAILTTEISFRLFRERTISFNHANVKQFFVSNLMYVWNGSGLPRCHDLGRKILTVYIDARLKEYGKILREKAKEDIEMKATDRSSKSIAMHQAADKMESITRNGSFQKQKGMGSKEKGKLSKDKVKQSKYKVKQSKENVKQKPNSKTTNKLPNVKAQPSRSKRVEKQ